MTKTEFGMAFLELRLPVGAQRQGSMTTANSMFPKVFKSHRRLGEVASKAWHYTLLLYYLPWTINRPGCKKILPQSTPRTRRFKGFLSRRDIAAGRCADPRELC